MSAGIIEFQTNVPREVVLKFPTGYTCQTKYGERVMYTTATEERFYVSPYVGTIIDARIAEMDVQPGEQVVIEKAEVKKGQKRGIEWHVSRPQQPGTEQAQQPAAPAPRPAIVPRQPQASAKPDVDLIPALKASLPPGYLERVQQTASIAAPPNPSESTERVQQPPVSKTSAAAPSSSVHLPNSTNGIHSQATGNGHAHNNTPTPQGSNGNGSIPVKVPYDVALTHFLITSGRAHREAERVLGAEGGSVRFDSRDICAVATSFLIHAFGRDMLTLPADWPGRVKVNGGAQ